jgi:hypothetical protein
LYTAVVSEPKRTPDGFVIAFRPLEGEFPFERDPVIEAYKKDVDRKPQANSGGAPA